MDIINIDQYEFLESKFPNLRIVTVGWMRRVNRDLSINDEVLSLILGKEEGFVRKLKSDKILSPDLRTALWHIYRNEYHRLKIRKIIDGK